MKQIPDGSIDAIITDPPYWTTACKWDSLIPFEPMWAELKRIIKPNGAIVLFGSEPFSSALRMSNIKMYKYDWIWKKTKSTWFFDAKKRPLSDNEIISVFYNKPPVYNPQMQVAEKIYKRGFVERKKSDCYWDEKDFTQIDNGLRYPKRIIEFWNADTRWIVHPTQKPVALIEYLIKTYTNEWETVLDFTAWSGTTWVACQNTNRNYILIEKDEWYCDIIEKRLSPLKTFLEKSSE